jgi:hypothetical protein
MHDVDVDSFGKGVALAPIAFPAILICVLCSCVGLHLPGAGASHI